MSASSVERTIWIAVPRERVWQAVTDPEQLTQWYATLYAWAIPSLEVGARIKFHNSDTEVLHATITVLEPPHQFSVQWDASDPESPPAVVTSFILDEENNGTRVTIHESGYESVPEAERQQWLDGAGSGYTMSLENLSALLEGRELPYQ